MQTGTPAVGILSLVSGVDVASLLESQFPARARGIASSLTWILFLRIAENRLPAGKNFWRADDFAKRFLPEALKICLCRTFALLLNRMHFVRRIKYPALIEVLQR